MLERFRAHARLVAATTMVSLCVMGGSAASLHQTDCHDAGCVPIIVEHDHSAHQLRTVDSRADAHPQHCLACHVGRSSRPHTEVRIVAAPEPRTGVNVQVEVFAAATAAPAAQPPLRSPPSSSARV